MTKEYIKSDHQFPPTNLHPKSLEAKISLHNSLKVGLVMVFFGCLFSTQNTDFQWFLFWGSVHFICEKMFHPETIIVSIQLLLSSGFLKWREFLWGPCTRNIQRNTNKLSMQWYQCDFISSQAKTFFASDGWETPVIPNCITSGVRNAP